MKQVFFACCFLMAGLVTKAQTDSLQEYTGKYKYPDGGPFTELTVTLDNGVLTGSTSLGSSEFKKTDTKDVFEIAAYGGKATFSRGDDGKIRTLRVQVQDIDVEGTREVSSWDAVYGKTLNKDRIWRRMQD